MHYNRLYYGDILPFFREISPEIVRFRTEPTDI